MKGHSASKSSTIALRSPCKEAAMATLRPNWPAGLPSPQALRAATDALARQYVLSETMLHTIVNSQALELAYLLTAYGLVLDKRNLRTGAAPSYLTLKTPRNSPLAARSRSRRHGAGRRVLVATPADTVN
jgi:hypothetical protein